LDSWAGFFRRLNVLSGTEKNYTKEFKLEAVKLVTEKGYKHQEAADSLGIAKSLISTWLQAFKKSPTTLEALFPGKGRLKPEDEKIKKLEKALRKVTQERDILKKVLGYFAEHPE